MTRKHFEQIAIAIGYQMRQHDADSTEREAIRKTAAALTIEFLIINPRFDHARFLEYVLDVAENRRDVCGKKVTA